MLGSSRVLNFRSGFLDQNPDMFYNAGASGQRLREIEAFVDALTPETAPDVLMIGLDQFWFNAAWDDQREPAPMNTTDIDFDRMMRATRRVLQDLARQNITLHQLMNPVSPVYGVRAIGMDAILKGSGYLIDGSRQTNVVQQSADRQQRPRNEDITALRNGQGHFTRGDTVSEEAMAQITRILDKAAALDIEVIGFTLPFMPTIYNAMQHDGVHSYLDKAVPQLQTLHEERGFMFFDFGDVSAFSQDTELTDGVHASELLSLKLYMRMVEGAPDLLGAYSDLAALQALVDQAPNPHEVIPREKKSFF